MEYLPSGTDLLTIRNGVTFIECSLDTTRSEGEVFTFFLRSPYCRV